MKVYLHTGMKRLYEKSGVGRAIEHQKAILLEGGAEIAERMDADTDIVHINTVFPDAFLSALRARAAGKLVICYGHSTMEDFRNSFKGSNAFAPFFRSWIKLCYNLGDIVITPTEYSRRLLLGYGVKKPVYALSNGIDIKYFKPDASLRRRFRARRHIPEKKKVVMSVGHFIERKGILEFIELARKTPETLFFWFGYTNLNLVPASVSHAIKNAPENVRFAGYVDREALREAYCGCDLFCFMSHEETEGIVVLEALACGIPVLVRDIPVYEGWLTHGVNAYKAADEKEFARLTGCILNGKVPNLTEAGRQAAAQRSLQAVGERLLQLYHIAEEAHSAGRARKEKGLFSGFRTRFF